MWLTQIKDIGFEYAMRSGTTIAVSDITVPPESKEIIDEALKDVEVVQRDFRRGLLTEQEQNERVIEIWQETTNAVARCGREAHGSGWQPVHHGQLRRDQGWFWPHFTVGRYARFDG